MFCHGSPLTNEHVFARWISAELRGNSRASRLDARIWDGGSPPVLRSRYIGDIDVQVKRVCRECNGGWMSELESGVQKSLTQMIRDNFTVMTPGIQHRLAAWSAKTAFMLQYTEPRRDVHRDYLSWLWTRREAPWGVWVGVGAYTARDDDPIFETAGRRIRLDTGIDVEKTTMRFGELIICVWEKIEPPKGQDKVLPPKNTDGYLRPVWPTVTTSLFWPPAKRLRNDAFQDFCDKTE